ncbi:ferritin-like domain-containing protein [Aminipila butyrica]|uniref:Ferritin-like domain-containing protein n=1 Tax=Aminipila butyrica TaxID=433296 RepID=A0A858C1B8_9FIRM|nr:ferritin-like domain-containing protein [Aminipila butyrica]QIB70286.1 ferritin-like domain-containing protein [Aminipila butyrica]
MDKRLIEVLQTYIRTELLDAAFYRELALMAPDEAQRDFILQIAADEQSHADDFKILYRQLTGENYHPDLPPVRLEGPYNQILRDRVVDEISDYQKYMYEQQEYFYESSLREAFLRAAVDENVHAVRLLELAGTQTP